MDPWHYSRAPRNQNQHFCLFSKQRKAYGPGFTVKSLGLGRDPAIRTPMTAARIKKNGVENEKSY